MAYEGELLNECGTLHVDLSKIAVVAVSGSGPNVCGHLIVQRTIAPPSPPTTNAAAMTLNATSTPALLNQSTSALHASMTAANAPTMMARIVLIATPRNTKADSELADGPQLMLFDHTCCHRK